MVLNNYTQYLEYETIQGDTFDSIALDFYDAEKYSNIIMQANTQHIKTLVFNKGIKLVIPVIEEEAESTLPPWRRTT